jgi:hypothetical protein
MRSTAIITAALLALPLAATAQGVTQSRDGLSTASQGKTSNNAMPAGSVNATTGPQSRPAYPSGSTSANPGAAFVATQPKPATGALATPSGITTTTKTTASGSTSHPAAVGVGQAATVPK